MINNSIYDRTKVLLIEDNPIYCSIVLIKLRQLGVRNVSIVENGLLALEHLQNNSPDLIFLDLIMPEMGGFEFLRFVDQHDFVPTPSIVILTTYLSTTNKIKALQFESVIDYVEKPIDSGKLNMALLRAIENKKVNRIA